MNIRAVFDQIQHNNFTNLEHLADEHPRAYFCLVLCAALTGYGVLLLFPLSAIVGFYQLSTLFSNGSHAIDYQGAIIWYAITVLGISVSYHILTLRFDTRIGTRVSEKRAPRLHKFIEAHNTGRLTKRLHSTQLTERFEIRVIKIPTTGIPLWSENVLLIGFPFMQTMSRRYFDCIISARLLQHTNFSHPVTHWLAQLADIWMIYPKTLKERGKVDDRLLYFFFNWYAPFYKSIARHMVQRSNMLGEQYALALYNDQDMLETIEAEAITEYFLKKYFWPKVVKKTMQTKATGSKRQQPYSKLPTLIERNLTSATISKILLHSEEQHQNNDNATLRTRISNLGHSRTKPLKVWSGDSGQYYFEENYQKVVKAMDSKWQAKISGLSNSTAKRSKKTKQKKLQLHTASA